MEAFISRMIIKEADENLDKGKEKYMAYFIKTALYLKWKDAVDKELSEKGYKNVIVKN